LSNSKNEIEKIDKMQIQEEKKKGMSAESCSDATFKSA
jgi:hypothetical protein